MSFIREVITVRKPNVLLVDDEMILHEMITRMLEMHFDVTSAYEVDDALDVINIAPPDVICTDLMMPTKSGLDLIRALKGDPTLRAIPIIVISATGYETKLREAKALGAFKTLSKPFGRIDLINTINAALE